MSWRVPLADIDFGAEEEEAAVRVVRGRWLSMGDETQAFETEFARFIGSKHAIAVTNATAALHLACIVAGLKRGDQAIVPSLTFVATANAVRYTGAKPVFADIEGPEWLTLSPDSVAAAITPKTRAILVMHYGGYPCNMPAIMEIARHHRLPVIEDSAHAIGSQIAGRTLGTWGLIGCFSFFSNKNMTTGEGGMLVTDDDDVAQRLRLLRSHGMTSLSLDRHKGHAWSYDVVDLGYNYRIDELRSAIGRVQLRKLPANNARRASLTSFYRDLLAEFAPQVLVPFSADRGQSCHHIMPILLPEGHDRTAFMEQMKRRGVQTSIHYPPVHSFEAYRKSQRWAAAHLPCTVGTVAREVTLPLYPEMSECDVQWVVRSVRAALSPRDHAESTTYVEEGE